MRTFTAHGTDQSPTMVRWAGSATVAAVILFSAAPVRADEPSAPPLAPSSASAQAPSPAASPSSAIDPSASAQPPAFYYGSPDSYSSQDREPRTLDWDDGDRVPSGYHVGTQARKGLVIGGAVAFGSLYMLSIAAAASGGARSLLIPVAGPFAALGGIHSSGADVAMLIIDGVLQAGGIAMFVAGVAAPKTVLVRNDIARGFVTPTPMTFGANSGGMGLVGTF